MKTIFSLLIFLAAVATVQADILTNGVKVSALTTATLPLAGTEAIMIVQSAASKQTTVASINNAPTIYASGISNQMQLAQLALNAAMVIVSNSIPATNAVRVTAENNVSNVVTAAVVATNTIRVTAENNVSNVVMAAVVATNVVRIAAENAMSNALTTQITLVANGLANVTNSGSLAVQSISTPYLVQPNTNFPTIVPTNGQVIYIDPHNGNYQLFTIAPVSGGITVKVIPTNFVSGLQVQAWFKSGGNNFLVNPTFTLPGFAPFGGPFSAFSIGAGGQAYLNWITLGTNLIYSGQAM